MNPEVSLTNQVCAAVQLFLGMPCKTILHQSLMQMVVKTAGSIYSEWIVFESAIENCYFGASRFGVVLTQSPSNLLDHHPNHSESHFGCTISLRSATWVTISAKRFEFTSQFNSLS